MQWVVGTLAHQNISYWVVTYQRGNNGQTFWNCRWSGLRSERQNAIGKTDEKWRTANGALVPPLVPPGPGLVRIAPNKQPDLIQHKNKSVPIQGICHLVENICFKKMWNFGTNNCKHLNHFWPNSNTCQNFWLTPIMHLHILEPQLMKESG